MNDQHDSKHEPDDEAQAEQAAADLEHDTTDENLPDSDDAAPDDHATAPGDDTPHGDEAIPEMTLDSFHAEPNMEPFIMGDAVRPALPDEDDDMDIDRALASVASLSDVMAQREAAEAAELARMEDEARSAEEAQQRRDAYYLSRPPLLTLHRGQLASIIPALVLITVGAWLTFALAAAETPPDAATIGLVLTGAFGIILFGYWLSSERWARGALFGGLSILLLGSTLIYLSESTSPGADGWPLVIVALGIATALSAILARPSSGRLVMVGVLAIAAGLAALAVTMRMIGTEALSIAATFGPAVVAVALALILLPVLLKRRG
jgi:hypothetical protein